MNYFEPFLATLIFASLYIFLTSFYQTVIKRNPYGLTRPLLPFGIFVWADGIILGLFWFFVGLFTWFFGSLNLFLIVVAVFWLVRSSGEVIYWFLQQFSTIERDPPYSVPFSSIFPGKSVWFAMQLIWQVVMVVDLMILLFLLGLF